MNKKVLTYEEYKEWVKNNNPKVECQCEDCEDHEEDGGKCGGTVYASEIDIDEWVTAHCDKCKW